jgi:radical SAM-linked protein
VVTLLRLRVWFTKGEEVRFISHLDLVKALLRAMRRGRVALAFSEGFNPHPKLSLASALRVGVTSEAEFMDVELAQPLAPDEFAATLGGCLPPGITIVAVKAVPLQAPALMAVAALASYVLDLELLTAVTAAEIQAALTEFLRQDTILVRRETSKGEKTVDIRPLTRRLAFRSLTGCHLQLEADLTMGQAGTGRPEEIGTVLTEQYHLPLHPERRRIHRTGLFYLAGDQAFKSLWDAV